MLDRCDRVQIAVHDAAKAAQRFGQLLGCEVARHDHSRHLGGQAHHPRGRRERVRALRARRRGADPGFPGQARRGADDGGLLHRRPRRHGEALGRARHRLRPRRRAALSRRRRHLRPADRDLREHLPAARRAGVVPLRDDQHADQRLAARRGGLCRPVRPRSGRASARSAASASAISARSPCSIRPTGSTASNSARSPTTSTPWAATPTSTATRSTCATSRCMTGRPCAADCSTPMRATRRAAPIPSTDPDGGWVHPKELHGLLLGVSRTGVAWDWSGRKDLVPPA